MSILNINNFFNFLTPKNKRVKVLKEDDIIAFGRRDFRSFNNYQTLGIQFTDLKKLLGSGGGETPSEFCDLTLTPISVNEGPIQNFNIPGNPTNNGNILGPAEVIPGVLELSRRDDGGGWFNSISELGFAGSSPNDTEWNSSFVGGTFGFGDLTDIKNRTYGTFLTALNFQVGSNYSGLELVCHVISTDQYFKVLITSWDDGNSAPYGGFVASFQEITLSEPCLITFSDGTVMNTAGGPVLPGTNVTVDVATDSQGTVTYTVNADVAIPVSRSVYVDSTYGDDFDAEKYNFVKPYRTLTAAMSAATTTDTIIVRPGSYGTLILQSNKKLHFMRGAEISQMTDNGVSIVGTTITGFGTINRGFNNTAVSLTGPSTDIYTEFDTLICAGTYFSIGVAGGNTKWQGRFKYVEGCRFNGFFYRPIGSYDIDLKIDSLQSGGTYGNVASPLGGVSLSFGEPEDGARLRMKVRNWLFVDGSNCGSLLVSTATNPNVETSIDIDKFTNLYSGDRASDGALPGACILARGTDKSYISIKEEVVIQNMAFARCVSGNGEVNVNNSEITCNNTIVGLVDNSSQDQRLNFKNSVLKRGSGGSDSNRVLQINVRGKLGIDNCKIVKESVGTDTNEMIFINDANQKTLIKNSEIVLSGTTGLACDSDSVANGEVYFRNTVSNVDNGVNITDIAVVSGFTGNDTALEA